MLRDYNTSDFKQYWMPDSNCKECYECGERFTAFRRRHHCRICGQIFCSQCCNQGIPGKIMGCLGDLRACTYCCNIVLRYIRSIDSAEDLGKDVTELKKDLQMKLGATVPTTSSSGSLTWSPNIKRKSSMGFREEDLVKAKGGRPFGPINHPDIFLYPRENKVYSKEINLIDLWMQIQKQGDLWSQNVPLKTEREAKTFSGYDLVNWLITAGKVSTRNQAVVVGQALLDQRYIVCLTKIEMPFCDSNAIYAAQKLPSSLFSYTNLHSISQDGQEPLWFKEIQTMTELKEEPQQDTQTVHFEELVAPSTPDHTLFNASASKFLRDVLYGTSSVSNLTSEPLQERNWNNIDILNNLSEEKSTYSVLESTYSSLEQNLVRQLLNNSKLSLQWGEVIQKLVHQALALVHPKQGLEDDIDIRQYIKVKKISGGTKNDCFILKGVACTKNIAHRKMLHTVTNPNILFLHTSIVYQRANNKLSTLEPIMMQENEYLKNIVAKISLFKPDVLIVEKNVSRLAQERLLKMGITLAYNMDPNVLERICRFTDARMVSSIDAHLGSPQLGKCGQFKVQTYKLPSGRKKTLMIFDGCSTNHGCTIIIRGGTFNELKRVKKIILFILYSAYNWRLERSFLMDEYATIPGMAQEIPLVSEGFSSNVVPTKPPPSPAPPPLPDLAPPPLFKNLSAENNISLSNYTSSSSSSSTIDNNADSGESDQPEEVSEAKSLLHLNLILEESSKDGREAPEETGRKLEIKQIKDFSDPLRSYLNREDDTTPTYSINPSYNSSQLQVASLPFSNQFRKALNGTVLCCSPFIKIALPYLETEAGRNCKLKRFFPNELFWSKQFNKEGDSSRKSLSQMDEEEDSYNRHLNSLRQPCHPLVYDKLAEPLQESRDIHTMLADFRARGARYQRVWQHQEPCEKAMNKENIARNNITESASEKEDELVDALCAFNHQKLSVLFCSHSYSCSSPTFCVHPHGSIHMYFYGGNDITLGAFLQRYCFNSAYQCPISSCDKPMTEHVRRFVHDSGSVMIIVQNIEKHLAATFSNIFMWSWCPKCQKPSKVSIMSKNTWAFSFAKYLELQFHGTLYTARDVPENCTHTLHQNFIHYFAHKNIVATFKYVPITLYEVELPPSIIVPNDSPLTIDDIVDKLKNLAKIGYEVYSIVNERLESLKKSYLDLKHQTTIEELQDNLKFERKEFRGQIEKIQLLLTSRAIQKLNEPIQGSLTGEHHFAQYSLQEACQTMWTINNDVINLRFHIAGAVNNWNNIIEQFVAARRKEDRAFKTLSIQNKQNQGNDFMDSIDEQDSTTAIPKVIPITATKSVPTASSIQTLSSVPAHALLEVKPKSASMSDLGSPTYEIKSFPDQDAHKTHLRERMSPEQPFTLHRTSSAPTVTSSEGLSLNKDCEQTLSALDKLQSLLEATPRSQESVRKESGSSSSSSVACGITQGMYSTGLFGEDQQDSSYVLLHHKNVEQTTSDTTSVRCHERSKSDGSDIASKSQIAFSKQVSKSKLPDDENLTKKMGVKNFLNILLNVPVIDPILSPFPSNEHFFLPQSDRVPVVVYFGDTGSLIAYVLASADYEAQLLEIKSSINLSSQPVQQVTNSPLTKRRSAKLVDNMSNQDLQSSYNDNSPSHSRKPSGMLSFLRSSEKLASKVQPQAPVPGNPYEKVQYSVQKTDAPLENDLSDISLNLESEKNAQKLKSSNLHIEVQASDNNIRIYCKVYFAEQFRKFRQLVFPFGEEQFIRSLSECVPWLARGGKSGLSFRKTKDDRFILKEMSKLEVQSFIDFGHQYFHYMSKSCTEQNATVMGKIVGVYRIGYKNLTNNSAHKADILVMENLFYNRKIVQKFDLKGSVRNRLVPTHMNDAEEDQVLQDENLLKLMCDSPFYIRLHSKTVLLEAIKNDTQFLSDQCVMDYSLLVGIDEEKKEFVIGIIDYIRTFTWDKKLEMVVKSSGILGGHGKLPTVVSPETYRRRFCEAMDRYFLFVPDRWLKLEQQDALNISNK